MKLSQTIKSKFKDQRGAVAVIVAVSMVMLIGFVALAIDVGYLYATRNELQNVADAAALAGAGALGDFYTNSTDPFTIDDRGIIVAAAQAVVGFDKDGNLQTGKNKAGGEDITIADGDIFINKFKVDDNLFETDDYNKPDAVRVIARRDADVNGKISMFFARIFNIDSLPVTADATAALTGPAKVIEGGLPIPVGIGKARFDSEYCDKPIKFYPTKDEEACGGWHVFHDDKTNLKKEVLDGLLAEPPTFIIPEVTAGDILHFTGGTDAKGFVKLKELFDASKVINDFYDDNGEEKRWPVDGDNDSEIWTTSVVVYDWEDCSNPNTDIVIAGFARIRIYEICTANSDPDEPITGGGGIAPDGMAIPLPPQETCKEGDKQIVAIIDCDFTEPERGGGGATYGIMGTIPGLVE